MQYEALETHQNKYNKNSDTHKKPVFSSVYSNNSMRVWEPWMHRVIVEPNGSDHRRCSYTRKGVNRGSTPPKLQDTWPILDVKGTIAPLQADWHVGHYV